MSEDRKALLEWIEKAAIENMKGHVSAADGLEKQCATTLTILFAGAGGGLVYAVKGVDTGVWTWLSVGASVFTSYLIVLAVLLVLGCMWIGKFPQTYNEPENLRKGGPDLSFEQIRVFELDNFQTRIQEAVDRNHKVADRLNGIRLAAVASPIVFIVAAACWAAWAS